VQIDRSKVDRHLKNHYRRSQQHGNTQSAAHVAQLGIAGLRFRWAHRLERHAADRTAAGRAAAHLGMHRAGVPGARVRYRYGMARSSFLERASRVQAMISALQVRLWCWCPCR